VTETTETDSEIAGTVKNIGTAKMDH